MLQIIKILEFVFLIIFAVSMIGALIAIIKPSKSLPFYKGEKTRIKAFLFWFFIFIITPQIRTYLMDLYPYERGLDAEKKQNYISAELYYNQVDSLDSNYKNVKQALSRIEPLVKEEEKRIEKEREERENKELNEQSSKLAGKFYIWNQLSLDSKEDKIKKHIEGKWFQDSYSIFPENDNPTLVNFDIEVISKGDKVAHFTFEDGFLLPKYKYEYINYYSKENPTEKVVKEGGYSIDDDKINIVIGRSDFSTESNNYVVLFISETTLIYSNNQDNVTTIYFANKANTDFSKFQIEKNTYIELNTKIAQEGILKAISLYESSNSLNGEALAISSLKNFESWSSLNGVKDFQENKDYGKLVSLVKKNAAKTEKDIAEMYQNKLKSTNVNIAPNYSANYKEVLRVIENNLGELSSIIAFRNKYKLSKNSINRVFRNTKNKYSKILKEYSLYGGGESYLMKSAAELFIKDQMKDPSSFDMVKAGVVEKRKNGFLYYVSYRGKNSFGALVLEEKNLILNYDTNYDRYVVVNAW